MTELMNFDETLAHIRRYRDELRVQMHLAQADARGEWQRLEQKWDTFSHKLKAARLDVGETSEDVNTALGLMADELRDGYQKISARFR